MKKRALSVLNPISYEICMGIKTVENRTWRTDYRGKIYIHSSGGVEFPIFTDDCYPQKYSENLAHLSAMDGIEELDDTQDFDALRKWLEKKGLLDEFAETMDVSEKIDAYCKKMNAYYDFDLFSEREDDEYVQAWKAALAAKPPFFKAFAIIGSVDLIDIVRDSPSVWAEDGCYHWILANPVLFDTPIINVKGRLRLFDVSHIIKD